MASSDESWTSCDVSPPTTTSEGSQIAVNEGQTDSPAYTGHVATDCRPLKLDYSSNLTSEGTQGDNSVFSPSSPLIYSQTPTSTTSCSTPVAAPRYSIKVKQLQEENTKLQNERDHLEEQNSQLSERVRMLKEANERNLKRLSEEKDRLNEENERNIDKIARLELSSTSSDFEKGRLELQLREKDDQIDKEKQERRNVESSLSSLRIDYERIDREKQRLEEERDRLKADMKRSPSVEQMAPLGKPSGRDSGVYRRLNDSIREKRELEEELATVKRERDDLIVGKQASEQENYTKLQLLQEENERMKHDQLAKMEQEKQQIQQQLQERTNQLRSTERLVVERDSENSQLREKCAQLEDQLRRQVQEKERVGQQFDDHRLEMESLLEQKKAEMDEARSHFATENESMMERIQQLELEKSRLESSLVAVQTEKDEVGKKLATMRLEKNELEEEKKKLSGHLGMLTAEKKKNQTMRDALKQEAEYIMTDLEEVNKKLRETAKERDDVKKQLGIAMNELSKRNTKLGQSEEQIAKLKEILAERDEQISIMDIQLKTYHSDFDTERKAREKMAERVEQMKDELQKKEIEIKRLHSQLNKSAANQMKAEMAEMENLQYYTSEMSPMDDPSMHYATVQQSQQLPYMTSGGGGGGQEPLRARDPDRTHPPGANQQGAMGQYQMHAPRH